MSRALRRVALVLALSTAVSGCVSTEMRSFVGRPIQDAQIAYGAPEQVIDMPDGAKAFQFRYGGGPILIPGASTTQATVSGPVITATTTGTPGAVVNSSGCLLTFIARPHGGTWVIEETRVPKGLVC